MYLSLSDLHDIVECLEGRCLEVARSEGIVADTNAAGLPVWQHWFSCPGGDHAVRVEVLREDGDKPG